MAKYKLKISKNTEIYDPSRSFVYYRGNGTVNFDYYEKMDKEYRAAGPKFYKRMKKWIAYK